MIVVVVSPWVTYDAVFVITRVAVQLVRPSTVAAVLPFGLGSLVSGSIRPCLNDMHHLTVLVRIPADIVRVVTHQYPPHRINPYVKFYLCHSHSELMSLYIVVILL